MARPEAVAGASVALSAPAVARRWPATTAVSAVALALAIWWAASRGAIEVPWDTWRALLMGEDTQGTAVLWTLRLPRVAFALVVGAALGLAGALSQGLFRNGLADPGLLGIPSGAVCAVALTLTAFAHWAGGVPTVWQPFVLPAAALLGAWGLCALLQALAGLLAPGSVAGLLLAGLALNALTMAVVGLCTTLATDEQLRTLSFWQLGSLAGASWGTVAVLVAVLLPAAWAVQRAAQGLNALALGEAVAGQVGVDVRRLRRRLVLLIAALSGLAVAWCGLVGFIGLLAPHAARALVGADHARMLPWSAFIGALLLLLGDTLARTLVVPAELPVGILTALLGAPVLLVLLRRAQRHGEGAW
jgi:iron complex transport system permease protein